MNSLAAASQSRSAATSRAPRRASSVAKSSAVDALSSISVQLARLCSARAASSDSITSALESKVEYTAPVVKPCLSGYPIQRGAVIALAPEHGESPPWLLRD